jgi:hypothetical protein
VTVIKKFLKTLGITLLFAVPLFILWLIVYVLLFIVFALSGIIEIGNGWSFYLTDGELLFELLTYISLIPCFALSYLIIRKKEKRRESICKTLTLWRNIGFLIIFGLLITLFFDDWLFFNIKESPIDYIILLTLIITFTIIPAKLKKDG